MRKAKKRPTWVSITALNGFSFGVAGGTLNPKTHDYTDFELVVNPSGSKGKEPKSLAQKLNINLVTGFYPKSRSKIIEGMERTSFTVVSYDQVIDAIEKYIWLHKSAISEMVFIPQPF